MVMPAATPARRLWPSWNTRTRHGILVTHGTMSLEWDNPASTCDTIDINRKKDAGAYAVAHNTDRVATSAQDMPGTRAHVLLHAHLQPQRRVLITIQRKMRHSVAFIPLLLLVWTMGCGGDDAGQHEAGAGSPKRYPETGETKTFDLTIEDKVWEVGPGALYNAWTYNGTIPGPTPGSHRGRSNHCVPDQQL